MDLLQEFPEKSINCCVTSPPYWNLRDYTMCTCRQGRMQHASSTLVGSQAGTPSEFSGPNPDCEKCAGTGHLTGIQTTWKDGWYGCLGMEPDPDMFVEHLVMIFGEVRRVLRDDGTLWINMGDTYAGGGRGGNPAESKHRKQATNTGSVLGAAREKSKIPYGIKAKDLIGVPWMLAFALREDGWYLRQDIIWHKNNPMPESVTDRCVKGHEYVFLLSKSKDYYFDYVAIKEPAVSAGKVISLGNKSFSKRQADGMNVAPSGNALADTFAVQATRNKRSVWTMSSEPFKEAHFATFPTALVEPMILAGCPEGGTVLDVFSGAATSGLVALRSDRNYIGIETNSEYQAIAEKRLLSAGLDVAVV